MTGWGPRLGVQEQGQPLLALLPRRLKHRHPTAAQPVKPPLAPAGLLRPRMRLRRLGPLRLPLLLPRLPAPLLPLPPRLLRRPLLLQPRLLPLLPRPRLLLALAQLPFHPLTLLLSLF